MADGLPPLKQRIAQVLKILEEEEFTEYIKQQIKADLFKLDLVAVDETMIASEVIQARESAQRLDWFMDKLREYVK